MDGRPFSAPAPLAYYDTPADPYYHPAYYPAAQPPPWHQARSTAVRPKHHRIRTLFVSGLPKDVSAREIHNLFRFRPGFQSCQLKFAGRANKVVAFAAFHDHFSAMEALNQINGRVFDPETGATLCVELAKSNSRIRVLKGPGIYSIIDERNKISIRSKDIDNDDGDSGSHSFDEPSDTDDSNTSLKDNSIAAPQRSKCTSQKNRNCSSSATTCPVHDIDDAAAVGHVLCPILLLLFHGFYHLSSNLLLFFSDEVSANLDNDTFRVKPKTKGTLECSTLFIANLCPTCTEEELKEELFKYQGFRVVKLRSRGSMPIAFADFLEVDDATNAMKSLQNCSLPSSDHGKLHVEYAKSKMRKHEIDEY